jgi:hypothetical protein
LFDVWGYLTIKHAMTDAQPTTNTVQTHPYEPEPRLIDDPERLKELYHTDGLSIRAIAANHTVLSHTAVFQALKKYGLQNKTQQHTDTGTDDTDTEDVTWQRMK